MSKEWKEPAHIVATQHTYYIEGCPFHTYTFEWEGSKYTTAVVSKLMIDRASLKILPWPVKILGVVDFGREYEVIRKDVGWQLWWILIYTKRRVFNNRPYQHFKWRVLMTLDIWGLAYQPESEMTSWRNIGRKRK